MILKSGDFNDKKYLSLLAPGSILNNVYREFINQIAFKVLGAAKDDEVQNVSFEISGAESDTLLKIKNGASFSDFITNKLRLQIWQDKTFSNPLVYEGTLSAQELNSSGADLVVNIGKLKMKKSGVFKPKKKIFWKVELTRSLGDRLTQIESDKQSHTISNRNL